MDHKGRIASILLGCAAALAATGVHADDTDTGELVWAGCGITKGAFMAELAKAYEKKTGVHIELQGGGATRGIRDTNSRAIHLGGACRTTIAREASEKDVEQVPVGWDALVVIVHPNNPVGNITFNQLRDIYLGKLRNWAQLGGPDAPMELYVRRGKISGVGRMLRELVFADYEQEFTAAHVMKSSGPLERAVTENPHAIAVTGVSSAKRREGLKILNLNGHEPNYQNIKNGDYVLYRPLYLVIPRMDSDPRVDAFIEFALSRDGQDVIKAAGTVPYIEAMPLVMKQIEQVRQATKAGL